MFIWFIIYPIDRYVFNVCDYDNSCFFDGCKYINVICLISAAVTHNDYHSQSDRSSSYLVFGVAEVISGEESWS